MAISQEILAKNVGENRRAWLEGPLGSAYLGVADLIHGYASAVDRFYPQVVSTAWGNVRSFFQKNQTAPERGTPTTLSVADVARQNWMKPEETPAFKAGFYTGIIGIPLGIGISFHLARKYAGERKWGHALMYLFGGVALMRELYAGNGMIRLFEDESANKLGIPNQVVES